VPRKVQVVAASLVAKGMAASEGKHHTMFHKEIDGVTTLITRISRSHDEIADGIAKLMANQCALHFREFLNLIDCPLSAEQWDSLVRERCMDGRNPLIFQSRR
jgi:hypothetical protein